MDSVRSPDPNNSCYKRPCVKTAALLEDLPQDLRMLGN